MTATPNATVSRSYVRALSLACAATLLPLLSHAAVHHAGKAHAPVVRHAAAAATARTKPGRRLEHADAAPSTKSSARSRRAEVAEATHGKTRTGREAIEAARAELRSAQAPHAVARNAHAVQRERTARTVRAAPTERPARAEASATVEAVADRATQDRVHAWYGSHAAAGIRTATADASTGKPKETRTDIQPDLSPTPRKATVADFDRALQQQKNAMLAAQAENQRRTTDEDDAAEAAATHIPSTAPTARVAAPFVHGDLLAQASVNTPSAPGQVTLSPAKLDRHIEKHPDTKPDAEVLAETPSGLNGASPSQERAIAAETAYADAPKLNLPRPLSIRHEAAPAVAAVKAAAKRPEMDPETAQAMTGEAFDESSDPLSGMKVAPLPALRALNPDSALKRIAANPDEDDEDGRAVTPAVTVNLYDTTGHLMLIPPMRGTHEILVHQNQMAVADGLERIQDDAQLQEMRRSKLLVSLPDTDAIMVNDAMPANRRYARPWTVRFLNDLARAHYARFHTPLVITSAVRTVEFQKHLVRINGNAAPPTGDVASPHLYGQAVDIAKRGMSLTEIAWMRAYLTPVEAAGKIDVEEEFQQACFHMSVYRRYLGLPPRRNTPPADPLPQRRFEVVKASPVPSRHRRHISALLAAGVR